MALSESECEPCKGGAEPLKGDEIKEYKEELEDWEVIDEHHLKKRYDFENFKKALDFVNKIGEIAEKEGHHPDIRLSWGKVEVQIYTHKIDGLHKNDFILAAKIDQIK